MSDTTTKRCSECNQAKPLTDFPKCRSHSDGLHSLCRECNKAKCRARYTAKKLECNATAEAYYQANKDKIRQYGRDYHFQNKEKLNAKSREYYQSNKVRLGAKNEEYARQNCKEISEYQKEWREENRAEINRRVNEANRKLRSQVFEAYGNRCYCCGIDDPRFLTLDHVNNDGNAHRHPNGKKRLAGNNLCRWAVRHRFPSSLRLACWNCNCARRDMPGQICPHQIPLDRP